MTSRTILKNNRRDIFRERYASLSRSDCADKTRKRGNRQNRGTANEQICDAIHAMAMPEITRSRTMIKNCGSNAAKKKARSQQRPGFRVILFAPRYFTNR
jgi:hypothetical protein